ncbi:hypothetical protein [Streptomyces sp. NPDC050988]|uniref:hypothetical protein n=1 Tax=Streptomyces sp. NPDC050988 TaxID=3365637 RepID=UPI00378FAD7D
MTRSGGRYQQQMIKSVLGGLVAALVVLPSRLPRRPHVAETVPLTTAVGCLPLGIESRVGCLRTSCRHWNVGTNPADDCNTREEVLISGAVDAPEVGVGCRLTGGR